MVSFICDACGNTVKKVQVEKHYSSQCRNCSVLSCIDCGVDFPGDTYKNHTSCITEAEKYQGHLYQAKDKENKGEAKQKEWLKHVHGASGHINDPKLKGLFQKLSAYANIPRKKKKFENFCKNSVNVYDTKTLDQLWDAFNTKKEEESKDSTAEKPTVVSLQNGGESEASSPTKETVDKTEPVEISSNDNGVEPKKKKKKSLSKKSNEESHKNIDNGLSNKTKVETENETTLNTKNDNVTTTNTENDNSNNKDNELKTKKKKKKKNKSLDVDSKNMENVENTDSSNVCPSESQVAINGDPGEEVSNVTRDNIVDNNENHLENSKTCNGELRKKKKKQKRSEKSNENNICNGIDIQTEQVVLNGDSGGNQKKGKKGMKHKLNCEELEAEDVPVKNKKKKEDNVEEEEKENQEEEMDVAPQGKFHWHKAIKVVLKQSADNEISIKKLRKKVLAAYQEHGIDHRASTLEESRALFDKKLKTYPKVKISKDVVKLVK